MEIVYKIIVLAIAVLGGWIGMKRGMLRQLMSLLGVAFGAVACRIFIPSMAAWLYESLPAWHDHFAVDIVYSVLASALIFFLVYFCFAMMSEIFRHIIGKWDLGAFDQILGCAFRLFRNLLMLSLVYNVIAVTHPDSALTEAQKAADANLIEIVMPIAPALLDNGYDKYEHLLKLEEAKTIS